MSEIDSDHAAAKLAAVNAVVVQITAALLDAVEPGLALEVITGIRACLIVPTPTEVDRLAAEEYLQRLADEIEARVRNLRAHR